MAQSRPAKEHWIDLSSRGGAEGREDCQDGWQAWTDVAVKRDGLETFPDWTVLDVGAGLGLSKTRIKDCTTQDPAPVGADLSTPISEIPSKSYDVVTAFDVIEHVVEDVDFLVDLVRIARRRVYLTTPNEEVSHAANGCHCREYCPRELYELVKPYRSFSLYAGDGRGLRIIPLSRVDFLTHTYPHQAVVLETDRNLHRWSDWYAGFKKGDEPKPYGDTTAYERGAAWLADCAKVEDWGCGMGWMRKFVPPDRYWGIDGTYSPFADEVIDLANYRSRVEGIYMRGVIEHDFRWRMILRNAIESFTKRMCLVLFTPMGKITGVIGYTRELGVPDLSFALEDLTPFFSGLDWRVERITSETAYGEEHIFYLERR